MIKNSRKKVMVSVKMNLFHWKNGKT